MRRAKKLTEDAIYTTRLEVHEGGLLAEMKVAEMHGGQARCVHGLVRRFIVAAETGTGTRAI